MRKYGYLITLVLIYLLLLPFFPLIAEGGTGSIKIKIALPPRKVVTVPASGAALPLSIAIQPLERRSLDDGDAGGSSDSGNGDGGSDGSGSDGDNEHESYPPDTWSSIPAELIDLKKIVTENTLEVINLKAGLYNLFVQYRQDVIDQFGRIVIENGRKKQEEYQLALQRIRVVEDQVTSLKDLLMKKGGAITGLIGFTGKTPGTPDFPSATVHVVGFAAQDPAKLPDLLTNKTITATDASGKFILSNLPEGTYTLAITPSGDAAATHAREIIPNVRVTAEGETNATPFGDPPGRFVLASTMGQLKGQIRLVDKLATGGSHSGTLVRAVSADGRFRSYLQVTDSAGNYDFGKIPIGKYNLYIQHAGYKISEQEVDLTASGKTINEYLDAGTKKFCGQVLLMGASSPRGDINGDGSVDLADAILALKTADGIVTAPTLGADVNSDGMINITEAIYNLQTVAGLRSLSTSLGGSLVTIPGTSLMAVTDLEGRFTISGIPERSADNWNYDLFIFRDGYKALKLENKTAQAACEFNAIFVTLLPHETVVKDGKTVSKGSLIGRAVLKKTSDDFRGIDIAIEDTGFSAKPNALGNFIFTDVPPGAYKLNYTHAGYKTVVQGAVIVAPDHTTEARGAMLIPRDGTIKGRVTLEGASDYSGIPIKIEPVEAQVSGDLTGTGGYFSIPVPENFNPKSNRKCVLDNTPSGAGGCTSSTSYRVVIGGGVWAHSEYVARVIENVDVPAGESVDLGTIQLQKPPEPPSSVQAAQKDGTSVIISWIASPSTDVAGYNVYYGTQCDKIDQKANTSLIASQTNGKWQFTVTGLAKGIPYCFTVQAQDQDSLASAVAPSDGSLNWTLAPNVAPPVLVPCINCSFESGFLGDIALVGDGSKGYVSLLANGVVIPVDFSVDPPTADGSNQVVIGFSAQPGAMAFNPARNELYVVNGGTGAGLYTIDTVQNTLKPGSINIGPAPRNVIVSPDGSTIYACSDYSGQNRVTVIDAASGSTTTITLSNIDPYGMAIARSKLYVVGTANGWVYVIDLDSASPDYRKVVKSMSVGVGAFDAVARPDGAYVYVSLDKPEGAVAVIDTATDQLVTGTADKPNPIPVGRNPMGMAVSGNILYVVNYLDPTNQITMINTETNTTLATGAIATGGVNPKALAVSPDGNKLYVVHEGSVTVIRY